MSWILDHPQEAEEMARKARESQLPHRKRWGLSLALRDSLCIRDVWPVDNGPARDIASRDGIMTDEDKYHNDL